MPHGFSLVPQMSDDAESGMRTREALQEVGRRFAAAAPEVIVVATPHGFRVPGRSASPMPGGGAGTLSWRGRQVEQNVPLDRRFVAALARAAERHDLPLVLHGYAGEGAEAVVPLDWGAMVPLWFLGHGRNLPDSGHVLADPPERDEAPADRGRQPSPSVPPESLVRFGRAIVEAAAEDGRRAAYVASCDWSHTHRADGPYGYHPPASEVDAAVLAVCGRAASRTWRRWTRRRSTRRWSTGCPGARPRRGCRGVLARGRGAGLRGPDLLRHAGRGLPLTERPPRHLDGPVQARAC
jgi:aromatic ring-opening dioxygenase LigB subunit